VSGVAKAAWCDGMSSAFHLTVYLSLVAQKWKDMHIFHIAVPEPMQARHLLCNVRVVRNVSMCPPTANHYTTLEKREGRTPGDENHRLDRLVALGETL